MHPADPIPTLARAIQAAMSNAGSPLDFPDAVCAACAFALVPVAGLVAWLMSAD